MTYTQHSRRSVSAWVNQLTSSTYCHWVSYGSTSHIVRGSVVDVDRHKQGLLILLDDDGTPRKVVWRCRPEFAERVIAGYYAAVMMAEIERAKQAEREERQRSSEWIASRVSKYYEQRGEASKRKAFVLQTLKDGQGLRFASASVDMSQTQVYDMAHTSTSLN